MSWYATMPRNPLTVNDVDQRISLFLQSQSARGSYAPRSIPQISVDIPVVTNLPLGAEDGSEVYYVASDPLGSVWHLRYRASSGSSFKWEFVGGSPLYSEDPDDGTSISTLYDDLTGSSSGPGVTVPLAGDYVVRIECRAVSDTSGEATIVSYDIGGTGASDNDAVLQNTAGGAIVDVPLMRSNRQPSLTANTLLLMRYRVTGGTGTFLQRFISITPVRVG